MFIEQVLPDVVGAKSDLLSRLRAEGTERGVPQGDVDALVSAVPSSLSQVGAFLDRITGLWRYEFGWPYDVGQSLWWGTHMWESVEHLYLALTVALSRLPETKRSAYLRLLDDPHKHLQTLAEMMPAAKINAAVPLEFEVAGLGNGNRTIDWVVGPHKGRKLLCDVKRRTADSLAHFSQLDTGGHGRLPEPNHNPALLFRNVEQKFVVSDPDRYLQGVWIATDIAQDEPSLAATFSALAPEKVHFAVFGDWRNDIHVLARRSEDKHYLLELFNASESSRFTFSAGKQREKAS